MKLIRARVQNFRSVEDSEEFEIHDLTCLVGKNEAGKTTILNALRSIHPYDDYKIDLIQDYPRRFATRFNERHPQGTAEVVRVWWKLDEADKKALADKFGPKALREDTFQEHFGFKYKDGLRLWEIDVDDKACLKARIAAHKLDDAESLPLAKATLAADAIKILAELSARTAPQDALLKELQSYRQLRFSLAIIDLLAARQPKFFFTSHFERMSGEVALTKLADDRNNNRVSVGDRIFLDFLEYAGTSLEELQGSQQREDLKAKCEAAGNDITEEIFQFWSQNSALEVEITFDQAKPGDKPPFHQGIIAQIRIRNTNHKASLPLTERSAGFVWFFSFLAQFKQLKKTAGNAIILLDEPGLTLHGKAQGDLLRYIIERLLPQHQVIFTTHSPFMVPADRLNDVCIVEDVVEYDAKRRPTVKGTKVRKDVLEVDDDTLFPLQGALGYEITQALFIGPNNLLVEGPSDILFLQALSQALKRRGKEPLNRGWTLTPSGGIDKIAPFVRLFGGNKLNVAVLSDLARGDNKKVETLKRSDILKAGQFFTVADFTGTAEADVEDVFGAERYAAMLNAAFQVPAGHEVTAAKLAAADPNTTRVVKQAEALFRTMPASVAEFSHFTPAEWLIAHPDFLDAKDAETEKVMALAENLITAYNKMLK